MRPDSCFCEMRPRLCWLGDENPGQSQRLQVRAGFVTSVKGFTANYNHTASSQERHMKKFLAVLVLVAGFCTAAQADVWKWVDANGKTHFVDTMKSI